MNQQTAQSTDMPPAWITELYAPMETLDVEGLISNLSEDVILRLGNAEPISGHDAVRAASSNLFSTIRGMTHTFLSVWHCGEDTMLVGEAAYNMLDGSTVRLPCATLVHRRADGLVDNMQTFIDMAPVLPAPPGGH
ncbi:nuclear transport factor 2 family protein [Streptomyces sp. NPDC096311]|uniref:nuclear transport factor 2 family protein n=1 Tax=Streptomyces sp. NPDC096311 TaxID=3366083 RepID=UPI003819823D